METHTIVAQVDSLLAEGSNHGGKTVMVYVDSISSRKQPAGVIMEPETAEIVGATEIGKVTIPLSAGVRETPLNQLQGVPVQTLASKPGIEKAYRAGEELPPIEIEVKGDKIQLLDGHHRLHAARKAGKKSIGVNWHLRG